MRKCDKCDNTAVWSYMPGISAYCDKCVPRGCECNHRHVDPNGYHPPLDEPDLPQGIENVEWKWIEDGVWTHIDEEGREYPCAEYMYDENGFEN